MATRSGGPFARGKIAFCTKTLYARSQSLRFVSSEVLMGTLSIRDLLLAHHIPLSEWGKGEASSFEKLVSEVESGECILVSGCDILLRVVSGVIVDVYAEFSSGKFLLREDRQVFRDGRVRRRNLDGSIGKKMRPGEHPIMTVRRALVEELSIHEQLSLTRFPDREKGPISSVSYPGLVSVYHMRHFAVTLPWHLARREGYVEEQEEKTTYFIWVPRASS